MLVFLIKRLLNAAAVMLAVGFLAFMIFRFVGDPVELMLNEQASQQQRDELRVRLGLDKPFPVQFATFIGNAIRGDFGISYRNQQDVFTLIVERFPATFELVLLATVLSLVIAFLRCLFRHPAREPVRPDHPVRLGSGRLAAHFAVGILFILLFSVTLGWLPAFGRGSVVQIGWWSTGLLTHSGRLALILPAVTLSLFQITLVMRLVRAEMLETMRTDFIRFARRVACRTAPCISGMRSAIA